MQLYNPFQTKDQCYGASRHNVGLWVMVSILILRKEYESVYKHYLIAINYWTIFTYQPTLKAAPSNTNSLLLERIEADSLTEANMNVPGLALF